MESWKLAGTVFWGLVIALAFLAVQTIASAMVALAGRSELGDEEILRVLASAPTDGFSLAVATFASTLICVPMMLGIAKLKKDANLRAYFALHPVPARTLGAWVGITLVFLALSDGLTYLLGKPIVPDFMREMHASTPLWLLWPALVVAAPLFEEAFFRGFLFTGFAASVGPVAAIAVTALLWAAIHLQYDLYGMATILVLGVLFGLARLRSGSLFVPLALHALTNLIAATEAALIG